MLKRLRTLVADDGGPVVIHECRECGTRVDPDDGTCPECGAEDVATYEIE